MLERARALGFLGPPSVDAHIAHARGLGRVVARPGPLRLLDLGSGGGVPGLVLALEWPRSAWTLLDAGERRCAFLREAVAALGLVGRVSVLRARAEDAGRDAAHRGRYDVVTARAFGRPAVTAECGAPFLRLGGLLVVSDPPSTSGGGDRWPVAGLAALGLEARPGVDGAPAVAVCQLIAPVPDRFPRRTGTPAKRPLW